MVLRQWKYLGGNGVTSNANTKYVFGMHSVYKQKRYTCVVIDHLACYAGRQAVKTL